MLEHTIPACKYFVVDVPNLDAIGAAWGEAYKVLGEGAEWVPYCGPGGCDCATAAGFEYYPPEFDGSGPLLLYIPVKPKA